MYDFEKYENLIKERLSEHRFIHSMNVAKRARELALLNGVDPDKAYLAGILHDITKEMLNGNYITAKNVQLAYGKLIEKLFAEVNPIPVKAALHMMGMDVGPVRLPLTELEETHKIELKRAMSEAGIRSL